MAYRRRLAVAVATFGVIWHPPEARAEQGAAVSATLAAAEESVTFGMLEARFHVADEWLLAVAGAYLDAGMARDEAQLRLSAIGTLSFGAWSVEARHLFSFSSASVERYRVRMRVVRPVLIGKAKFSARAFDEAFFDFDRRRLFRNNVAIGLGLQLTDALSGELYQVFEMNRSSSDDAYTLALMTFSFGA